MGTMFLTSGDDVYYSDLIPSGGADYNYISGAGGNDYIVGNGYTDIIVGGTGNDTIGGEGGTDALNGNDGDDSLFGGDGNDTLNGDDGNDGLYGNDDNDVLIGGDGTDTLHGGTGEDVLHGGDGNDIYVSYFSDGGIDTIAEFAIGEPAEISYGGGGTDQLNILDCTGAELYVRQDPNNNDNLIVTSQDDMLDNGVMDSGVKILNFFAGGDHVIEYIVGSDGAYYDLTSYV